MPDVADTPVTFCGEDRYLGGKGSAVRCRNLWLVELKD